jgi:uncharacterized RDD family membrane protein YckC
MSPFQPNSSSAFSDVHTVETPEQVPLQFALAGIGSRFLALALDMLIQFGAGIALLIVLAVLSVWKAGAQWFIAILLAGFFVLQFGYFIFFEILWNGQTPGKRQAGLRVIKDSGRPLTPFETVGRNLLRIVDQLPGLYAVGLISIAFSKRNQRLGDLLAGAIVVREGKAGELPTVFGPAAVTATAAIGGKLLPAEELALVESFLARREQLDPGTRQRVADQIIARIAPKLGLDEQQRFMAETTLERVAWESRSLAS